MCKKCESLLTVKPGEKRRMMIYDMSGRYAETNTYCGYVDAKIIAGRKLVTMTHILHIKGMKFENTVNIHNCPFCGENLM